MNWNRVTVVTAPTGLPITVEDMKCRIRVDIDADNELIEAYIRGAQARIDGPSGIGYALIEQTWRLSLDCFPSADICLPGAPVKSVTSVNYVDTDGVNQVVNSSNYYLDVASSPVRLAPSYGNSWPATRSQNGAVWIDYVVGEAAAANIAPDLVDALALIVGHRYENREAVADGSMVEIPLGVESILSEYQQSMVTA